MYFSLGCTCGHAMLCYVMLRGDMLCYATLCYAILCYAMVCCVLLRYAMLCYAMYIYIYMHMYSSLFNTMSWHATYRLLVGLEGGLLGLGRLLHVGGHLVLWTVFPDLPNPWPRKVLQILLCSETIIIITIIIIIIIIDNSCLMLVAISSSTVCAVYVFRCLCCID